MYYGMIYNLSSVLNRIKFFWSGGERGIVSTRGFISRVFSQRSCCQLEVFLCFCANIIRSSLLEVETPIPCLVIVNTYPHVVKLQ